MSDAHFNSLPHPKLYWNKPKIIKCSEILLTLKILLIICGIACGILNTLN